MERHHTLNLSHSYSVTECTSLMQQDVHLSGVTHLRSTPYTVNAKGQGPAWSNSLFEDAAEFGYGMLLAQKAIREGLKAKVEEVAASDKASEEAKAACNEWLETYGCGATNGTATDKLVAALEGCDCPTCKDIVEKERLPR